MTIGRVGREPGDRGQWRRLVVVWLVASGLAGCGWMSDRRDANLDLPRDADGIETWDLREPPTADDVGIEPGQHTVVYSTLQPRRVRLLLPEQVVIDAELTTVTFDNFLAPDGDEDPYSFNLHSTGFPFDEAKAELRTYLSQLGLPDDAVAGWQADVDASEDERPVRGGDSATIGYVEIGVGGRFTFQDDAATLSWGAGWGPLMHDGPVTESAAPDPA